MHSVTVLRTPVCDVSYFVRSYYWAVCLPKIMEFHYRYYRNYGVAMYSDSREDIQTFIIEERTYVCLTTDLITSYKLFYIFTFSLDLTLSLQSSFTTVLTKFKIISYNTISFEIFLQAITSTLGCESTWLQSQR